MWIRPGRSSLSRAGLRGRIRERMKNTSTNHRKKKQLQNISHQLKEHVEHRYGAPVAIRKLSLKPGPHRTLVQAKFILFRKPVVTLKELFEWQRVGAVHEFWPASLANETPLFSIPTELA